MAPADVHKIMIGRAENLDFPRLGLFGVPARIDTGAKTSALWVSGINEKEGELRYVLFDKTSPLYTGKVLRTRDFTTLLVTSTTGHAELRYVVKHSVTLADRKIRARFTLANRASQAYPVLVGRNILRGKFLVDVSRGQPDYQAEKQSRERLQTKRKQGKERV